MAISKGQNHSGKIGHLIGRVLNGKQVLQSAGKKPNQTEATKKSASLFGTNSSIAFWIRRILCNNSNKDSTVTYRLNSALYAIIRQCYEKTTDSFTFTTDSFDGLRGFDFNLNSPLASYLWLKPQLTIIGKQMNISLPELQVPRRLKFPINAISCVPIIDVLLYVPTEGALWEVSYELEEISNVKETISAQEFNIDFPPGCIGFVGISLFYYSKEHHLKKMMNNKAFSPAGIVGTILNPGIPSADDLITGWNDDEDIKLKNVTCLDSGELDRETLPLEEMQVIPPTTSKIAAAKSIKTKKTDLQNKTSSSENTAMAIARNLRKMGLTDKDILKATSLSVEDLKRL
jgi:hypothetical protein